MDLQRRFAAADLRRASAARPGDTRGAFPGRAAPWRRRELTALLADLTGWRSGETLAISRLLDAAIAAALATRALTRGPARRTALRRRARLSPWSSSVWGSRRPRAEFLLATSICSAAFPSTVKPTRARGVANEEFFTRLDSAGAAAGDAHLRGCSCCASDLRLRLSGLAGASSHLED